MSVNFCLASGSWPKTDVVGCGFDPPTSLEIETAIPLGTLGHIYEEPIPKKALVKCLSVFEQSSYDSKPEIERFRTFFTLMQSKDVLCVNFIPCNPEQLQTIHVMRLQKKQDPKTVPVYCHAGILKYILPVQEADHVFDLSKERVSDTVQDIMPGLRPIIEKALGYFLKDNQAKGVAVTFNRKSEKTLTCIWLK
jgi:hypothetical protein